MRITEKEMIKELQNKSYFSVKHNGKIVLFVTNENVYKADGYTLKVSEKLRGGYSATSKQILERSDTNAFFKSRILHHLRVPISPVLS